jgi:hypothetical protein
MNQRLTETQFLLPESQIHVELVMRTGFTLDSSIFYVLMEIFKYSKALRNHLFISKDAETYPSQRPPAR